MSTLLQFLLALAPYLAPPIIAALVVLVQSAIAKLPANKRDFAANVVNTVVAAVDQMASDQLNGPGKKQMALELVEKELKAFGMQVPESTVNALIEEAVKLSKSPAVVVAAPVAKSVPIEIEALPGKASPQA